MRVLISIGDYWEAEQFIKATISGKGPEVVEALLRCAIICYARPYSGNEKEAHAAAESNLKGVIDPKAVLDAAGLALHDRIMNLRNKVVAHSESEFNQANFTDPKAHGFDPATCFLSFESRRWTARHEGIDLGAFEQMAREMRLACLGWFGVTGPAVLSWSQGTPRVSSKP
jgi:hypothetical protein